jgi:chorismate mutase
LGTPRGRARLSWVWHSGDVISSRGAASTVLVAVVVLLVASACGTVSAVNPPARPVDGLNQLVKLSIQRLRAADTVAAAKWGRGGTIADPAREKVVLDAASAGAAQRGLDPRESTSVFHDQIEASKVVQDGLLAEWSAEPARAPTAAPDLGQVRQLLDRITGELLDALAATRPMRASAHCATALRRAVSDAERDQHLDPLHRRGLDRAVRSVCR